MNNRRTISYFGKENSSNNNPRFGLTLQDGNSTPNIIQKTIIPATVDGTIDTLQTYNFLINASDNTGSPAVATAGTLSITVDLTLSSTRYYQFNAILTIIVQSPSTTYNGGHYIITGASKGTTLIGSNGYTINVISKDIDTDSFVPPENITLSISGNKFIITITAASDISSSLDMLADIKINSATNV
jgi:hypothetical protein